MRKVFSFENNILPKARVYVVSLIGLVSQSALEKREL